MSAELKQRIAQMVRAVEADEPHLGVLSTGERIAVAMVLDRPEWLVYGTMLECMDRLGQEWFLAALAVQRNGWRT